MWDITNHLKIITRLQPRRIAPFHLKGLLGQRICFYKQDNILDSIVMRDAFKSIQLCQVKKFLGPSVKNNELVFSLPTFNPPDNYMLCFALNVMPIIKDKSTLNLFEVLL